MRATILWATNSIFGYGDFGNLPCMRRISATIIIFMHFWWNWWWFELIGNKFWRLCLCKLTATFILAENSIFGILFCNFGKIMKMKFLSEKGSDPFFHFATQYYELRDETICIGKPTISAFQCVKNQLPTRSGSLCGDKSVFGNFGKIVVANPKLSSPR